MLSKRQVHVGDSAGGKREHRTKRRPEFVVGEDEDTQEARPRLDPTDSLSVSRRSQPATMCAYRSVFIGLLMFWDSSS